MAHHCSTCHLDIRGMYGLCHQPSARHIDLRTNGTAVHGRIDIIQCWVVLVGWQNCRVNQAANAVQQIEGLFVLLDNEPSTRIAQILAY